MFYYNTKLLCEDTNLPIMSVRTNSNLCKKQSVNKLNKRKDNGDKKGIKLSCGGISDEIYLDGLEELDIKGY